MIDWRNVFDRSLSYTAFVDAYATPAQRARWDAMYRQTALTSQQTDLLSRFSRTMPVVCLAGAWCGDCMNQCPIFDHFSRASETIKLRFLDRDALPDVREALAMNGGQRVPMVVFLSEDWNEVARYGERTLSIYRRLAATQLGPSCPTGVVPPTIDETAMTVAEWLNEFERAHLVLRLSPRLRDRHGD
jgi:hypothetical protein